MQQQQQLVASPFELFPVELLYPEHSGEQTTSPVGKNAAQERDMSNVYRELSEKSGLAILRRAVELTGGNVIFGNTTQAQMPREKAKKSYHKSTFYMAPLAEQRVRESPLEVGKKLADALNIVVVSGNIKYITKDFLMRHGFQLEHLIKQCEVPIEELYFAHILHTFEDLLDLKFKARDLVIGERLLFNTTKLATFYGVYYEDLRSCKHFSLTAYDLAECEFYPNELKTLEFSFDPMITKGYINKKELAKLKFSLADMELLGFTAEHARALEIDERDARRLFKWDKREFAAFCPSEESNSDSGESDS